MHSEKLSSFSRSLDIKLPSMPIFPHLTISIFFTRLFIRLVNFREKGVSLYVIFCLSVPYLLLVGKIYRQRRKNPTKKMNSLEVHVRVQFREDWKLYTLSGKTWDTCGKNQAS